MSKSRGNVLYADDLVDFFGVDAVRYFVLHEMPFENDGVITWELMVERFNSDLANTLGNLVNRTISMSNKYFDGVVSNPGITESVDDDLKACARETVDQVTAHMEQLRVADAISDVFALFKRLNRYIDETEPWLLARDEARKDRLATVLYNLVEGIYIGSVLIEAFMPDTAEKIRVQLHAEPRSLDSLQTFGLYPDGGRVTDQPEILFARQDIEKVMEKVEQLTPKEEEDKPEEAGIDLEPKPEISYDAFSRMQFQVGTVLSCEPVPKSRKLLCLKVQVGSQIRQIVSGIAKYYQPDELIGKSVMVLSNLKPAKLAGVKSEGMILCAADAQGNLSLVTPDRTMPSGAEIS